MGLDSSSPNATQSSVKHRVPGIAYAIAALAVVATIASGYLGAWAGWVTGVVELISFVALIRFTAKPLVDELSRQIIQNQFRVEELMLQNEALSELKKELDKKTQSLEDSKFELQSALNMAQQASQVQEFTTRRQQELFSSLPVACITFGTDGLIYEWNRAATKLFGIPAPEAIVRTPAEVFNNFAGGTDMQAATDRALAGESLEDHEVYLESQDGEALWILGNCFPLRGADGAISTGVGVWVDITDRKLNEERMEVLATRDGLTGLRNHRTFQDLLEEAFIHARRTGTELSLLLMDVDHFKKFNDSFGHQAGDDVLRGVARLLEETAEESDFVARYGGEEFTAILTGTGAQRAAKMAEAFRAAIESSQWEHREITLSIGIATLSGVTQDRAELIRQADEALYVSKDAGRNRWTHYTEALKAA